jgi:hypothetical protein
MLQLGTLVLVSIFIGDVLQEVFFEESCSGIAVYYNTIRLLLIYYDTKIYFILILFDIKIKDKSYNYKFIIISDTLIKYII